VPTGLSEHRGLSASGISPDDQGASGLRWLVEEGVQERQLRLSSKKTRSRVVRHA
jgi:hypothetical protein